MRASRCAWAILTVFLAGCASASSQPGKPQLAPRAYAEPVPAIFGEALQAVGCLRWEVRSADEEAGIIEASTPLSVKSWGENVRVSLVRVADDQVQVAVRSQVKAQVIDWGKNEDNIREFYRMLDAIHETSSKDCPSP